MSGNPVCDKDCFHCPYPDCILDDMDHEDYKQSVLIEKELLSTPERRKLAAQQRAYYQANKDKGGLSNDSGRT